MKQYLSLLLTTILLLSTLIACSDKRETSSEIKNNTVKNSSTSVVNTDDKPSSKKPYEDEDEPNSLIVITELENGKEKELSLTLPSSINLDEYGIYGKVMGVIEGSGDGPCEVEIYYKGTDYTARGYICYTNTDFTLEAFAGFGLHYRNSSIKESVFWDNNGKLLVQNEENYDEHTSKETLCSGYCVEGTEINDPYTHKFIYKDPNGNEISAEKYQEECGKILTYYVDGHKIFADL